MKVVTQHYDATHVSSTIAQICAISIDLLLVSDGKLQVRCSCSTLHDSQLTRHGRYEYVKEFERDEILLPNTWVVVRIDGRGFHR